MTLKQRNAQARQPKPDWLKVKFRITPEMAEVRRILKEHGLHTVCEEAACPNLMECFSRRTATFMILGSQCTRDCTFCDVQRGTPLPVDPDEPEHTAAAAVEMGLKHVVITSVTRDDLADGGADQFVRVIEAIRKRDAKLIVEVLIPDFRGSREALATVVAAKPSILNHNIETVPRLYPEVRPSADYQRSLDLLQTVKQLDGSMITKSGIMVGLGETTAEVTEVMQDLRRHGCDLLTIGQYLAPSNEHHPIVEYVTPETFDQYKEFGDALGFRHTAAAPLVRSSYHADQATQWL